MSFPPIAVTLLRSFARAGVVYSPGDQAMIPIDEAESMFRAGWAVPQGAEPQEELRPRRGTFKEWAIK